MIEIVNFYNKFEEYAFNISKKIRRNYLKKSIVFKYNKRIAEVLIKEKELTIVFLNIIKDFDLENRLFVRKGYEKQALSYAMNVNNEALLNYAVMLFDKEFELLTDPFFNNKTNDLQKKLSTNIRKISSTITKKKLNKGIVFKSSRNFVVLEKRKYGIYVRISDVEDDSKVLGRAGRSNYEPLCKFYNVVNYYDIGIVMPYIKKVLN